MHDAACFECRSRNNAIQYQTKDLAKFGKRAAANIISHTKGSQNIIDYHKLISFAGLSPTENTGDTILKGRVRICKQGGKQQRHILYMGPLNATTTNRACRELFNHLVARGKTKKAAIIAVCNKLLKQVF